MEANELMIGDYIQFNKSVYRVEEISLHGWIHLLDIENNIRVHMTSDYILDYIEGVILTPEILEKNGFTKEVDANNSHYWFTLIDDHTKFSLLYVKSIFQWLGPLDFNYVHELQHALKLCGINKNIKLIK
jgi:hypothetical protein